MREQLIQYVSLLFSGTENCEDIRQEILQNTLDRYDDLIAAGKSPEYAYRQAISGIGDINEILAGQSGTAPDARIPVSEDPDSAAAKRLMRALAIALYILSITPLMLLSEFGQDTLGFCFTIVMVAVATVLLILGKKEPSETGRTMKVPSDRKKLQKGINNIVGAAGLAAYFIVSFTTHAWALTWLIFPLTGAVQGLLSACLDLMEVK